MRQPEPLEHRPVHGDNVAGRDRQREAHLPVQREHVLGVVGSSSSSHPQDRTRGAPSIGALIPSVPREAGYVPCGG